MAEPPSIDGNELTDKGYINQARRPRAPARRWCKSFIAEKPRPKTSSS